MSDFFLACNQVPIFKQKLRYKSNPFSEESAIGQHSNWRGAHFIDNREGVWQSATHPEADIQVAICGRISLTEQDWNNTALSELKGGLAARWVLHQWMHNKKLLFKGLDGVFTIIVLEGKDTLHLITDPLGALPVYKSNEPVPRFSTHTDALAGWMSESGTPCTLNLSSAAEVLATESLTAPYTYYNEIEMLSPGHHYTIDLGRTENTKPTIEKVCYWDPYSLTINTLSQDEWGIKIASAIQSSMAKRFATPNIKLGLLLSGGLDARAILFAAPDPSKLTTITLYDSFNGELLTSRQLAKAAGSTHHEIARNPEHYGLGAKSAITNSAGQFSMKDAHYVDTWDKIRSLDITALASGCFADWLLKAVALDTKELKFLKLSFAIERLKPAQHEYYKPFYPLAKEWQIQLQARLNKRYPKSLLDVSDQRRNELQWNRIFPIAYEPDAMSRRDLVRSISWEAIFSDREIITIAGQLPPEMKLNERAYRQAFKHLMPDHAKSILNNNDDSLVSAGELSRSLRSFKRSFKTTASRYLSSKPKPSITTKGSWPNFEYYVQNSPVIKSMWDSISTPSRELINDLMGQDVFALELTQWQGSQIPLLLRILTFGYWLDNCRN